MGCYTPRIKAMDNEKILTYVICLEIRIWLKLNSLPIAFTTHVVYVDSAKLQQS